MKIVVLDYESGNIRSVTRALESQGASPIITGDASQLQNADAVVLPGVGSGPSAMLALSQRGLIQPLRTFVASGKPFLGVCLGLQLLLERTEEGGAPCLEILKGQVRRLPDKDGLKIPHMGWNNVNLRANHPIIQDIPQNSYFYFVHSYYADLDDSDGVLGATEYNVSFCSIYARGNLIATQFHPEKSGAAGLRLYKNFVALAAKPQKPVQSSVRFD